MKINYFYIDVFYEGGVPDDVRSMFYAIEKKHQGQLIGKKKGSNFKETNTQFGYSNTLTLLSYIFRKREFFRKNINVIVGGLIIQNYFIFLAFKLFSISFIFQPNSQLNQWSLKHKIFNVSPVIDNTLFNMSSAGFLSRFIQYIFAKLSVLGKNVYVYFFCKSILRNCLAVITLSDYELSQLAIICPEVKLKNLKSPLGYQPKQEQRLNSAYYKDYPEYINLVYWGRLDYLNKGIDRLCSYFETGLITLRENKVKIHFLGPDYNRGRSKLEKFILDRRCSDIFVLPLPHLIAKIDLAGLVKSDALLFPTRWDGYPRALREAMYYRVPIIASVESNLEVETLSDNSSVLIIDWENGPDILDIINWVKTVGAGHKLAQKNNENYSWKIRAAELVENLKSLL